MLKSFDSIKNPEFEKLRVGLLFQQGMIVQATGFMNALIYIFLSSGLVPFGHLVVWTIFTTSILLYRSFVQKWFNSSYIEKNRSFDPQFWERVFISGTLLSGLSWAIAGTYLLPADNLTHQAFLGFLLAGTTAGAAVAYCTSTVAIQAFLLPALLPLAIHFLLIGGKYRYGMALLTFLYILVLSALMKRMNKHVTDSIRLQFEKDHLLKELQTTQSKIVHTTKMAALGIMAGGISHEINNPLAAIRLNSSSLRDLAQAPEVDVGNVLEIADSIDKTVVRIAKIISGLKSFAREGKQDETELAPLQKIISETLDFCQARFKNHGIALTVTPISPDLVIQCRRVQIGQVLLNLLNNAFDAIQDQPKAWVRIEVQESANEVAVAVVDSGPGIPVELRDKLMQPFFTTKEVGKGTGLGLSIADGILKSHGGTFALDTDSSHTRFVFHLPRVANTTSKSGVA
jgi:signal transduction histidine kinase